MVAPVATSPLSFTPSDTLAGEILIDLSSPDASLSSVAAKHHIPLATLSLWLTKPETQALLHSIESGGYAHTRLAASLNLSTTIPVLLQILSDFRTLAASHPDSTDPAYLRASIHARKAAWMLQRLARSHPLTPAQLSAARDTLDTTRAPERPRSFTAPTPAPATPHIAPVPAATPSRETETHTSAEPLPQITSQNAAPITSQHTTHVTAQQLSHPEPITESQTNEPAPHEAHPLESPSLDAASFDAVPTPADDLSDLVATLSSIAESLGIDISELDHLEDLDNLEELDTLDDLLMNQEHLPPTAPNNATGPPQPTPSPSPHPTKQPTPPPTNHSTRQIA